eukprot:CAMPEP_0168542330 /NCGR_PEP_ID=MMETSP0413-20121227/1289_1 /TAXON_ID=136452 /ORGANISM="Filamoeba nolandi, Strain NC-AS-23-1" /LENGTH=532 /DNA_ID=CAMNT_0008572197 /DNA_START=156 /DNA_END=1756 /DNA_ORIENTATION=+
MSVRHNTWERFWKASTFDDIKGAHKEDVRSVCKNLGFEDVEVMDILTTFDEKVAALQTPPPKRIKTTHKPSTNAPSSGQFIDVANFEIAGLDELSNPRRLFVREEWAELWNELESKDNLLFTGPPGTGKSSLVWAWCLHMASQKKDVTWVHVELDGACRKVDIADEFQIIDADNIADLKNSIYNTAALLVIDGVSKDHQNVSALAAGGGQDPHNRRFILVSSLQFVWKGEELSARHMRIVYSHGWRFEEYQTACMDKTFYDTIAVNLDAETDPNASLKDKLHAKFFFAGASARWMFYFNTKDALKLIDEALSTTHSVNDLMQGLQGNRALLSVNHLTTSINNKSMLTSQYVTRQIAYKTELQFVIAATKHASALHNQSFDGWRIFQMDFLFHLEKAAVAKSHLVVGDNEAWKVSGHFKFFQENDLLQYATELGADCWLVPTKVNQDCFDVLALSDNVPGAYSLRVIQLTVAKSHSLKLRYVIKILATLQTMNIHITKLDVVIESDKNSAITNLGWDPKQTRVLDFCRAGGNY